MTLTGLINVNQTSGYVDITTFKFTPSLNPLSDVKKVLWTFGDGSTSTKLNASHRYNAPGKYTVVLKCFTATALALILEQEVYVTLLLNDSIKFVNVPPPTFAGHYNRYPFRIHITSHNLYEHRVKLSAIFSRAEEADFDVNKWSFLKPRWRFFDLNGKFIDSVVTKDTILKCTEDGKLDSNGTYTMGVSGYADFYFIDDIYNTDLATKNQPYTSVVATLETLSARDFGLPTESNKTLPNFSNSVATAVVPYLSLWRTPDYLKISENGMRDYVNPRWSSANTPVVISASVSSRYLDQWPDGLGVAVPDINSFFIHNFPLSNEDNFDINVQVGNFTSSSYVSSNNTQTITIYTSTFNPIECTFNKTPSFEWSDYSLHKTPGYYKGLFDLANVNQRDVQIVADTQLLVPNLSCNSINPLLWVSNPEAGRASVAQYNHLYPHLTAICPIRSVAHVQHFEMPIQTVGLSGFHGIYGIAATPGPQFHAWMIDSDLQYLYRVNSLGSILCAIYIPNILTDWELPTPIPNVASPASVVLNSNQELWITLYDSPSTLKLDAGGNFITVVQPPSSIASGLPARANLPVNQQTSSWYDQSTYFDHTINLFDDIQLVQATCADTDIYNNLYVTYSNPFSSFVVKYNSDGSEVLDARSFGNNSTPEEIVCDKNGDFWIALTYAEGDNLGYIQKRNEYLTLINNANFGPYKGIGHLTIDSDQNLWFTYNYRSVGKITNIGTYDNPVFTVNTFELVNNKSFDANLEFAALEGICADAFGKIHVINSIENQIYTINKDTLEIEGSFFVNPQGFVYYLDSKDKNQILYSKYNKSLQAHGDWSGFRWANKYANYLPFSNNSSFVLNLSGVSSKLNFYIDNKPAFNIAKHNENFDLANYLKELSFMPILHESPELLDNFFKSIFGGKSSNLYHDDLGVSVYEKIANFVMNHVDVDTCSIDQLYSLSHLVDLDTDDFRLNFPEEVERLINLISINLTRLRGIKNANLYEFYNQNYALDGFYNKGTLINSETYLVKSQIPVVLRNKNLNSFRVIYTGPVSNLNSYTVDQLANFLKLKQPWRAYYEFYEYVSGKDGEQLEGVIDWDNPSTTLNYQASSLADWYSDAGIIETLFSYELYNGLNLLNK